MSQNPNEAPAKSNMALVMALGVPLYQKATSSVEIAPASMRALPKRDEATPAISAQCQTFGFVAADPAATPPVAGNPGIPGTCANLRGNLGRNVVIGPGLSKLDFSVFKNNYVRRISETFNAQFRAEIFNIFNRANFSSPTDNLTAFDQNGQSIPSAGLLTSTQTTSRQIQFALKLIW